MRIINMDEHKAIVRVFLAPSVISPEGVAPIREKFEYMLAELSTKYNKNIFLKRIFRAGDYYAIIVVEDSDYERVARIGEEVEKRTRMLASRLKRLLFKAIEHI